LRASCVSLNPKLRYRINAPTLVGGGLLLFCKRRDPLGIRHKVG
jgi:hypothetical protein